MQAQATPPAPPPPAIIRKEDIPGLLAKYPSAMNGPTRLIIIGLTVSGDRKLLDAMKAKVQAEGWNGTYVTLQTGATVLSIGTEHKTLEQAIALAKRAEAREFGAVDLQPLAIPDPSAAK